MNNKIKIIIIQCFFICITSCVYNQNVSNIRIKENLDDFVDCFYNHYYTFPTSSDTLVFVMESRMIYIDESNLYNYNETINFLKKHKNHITWELNEKDLLHEELVVLFERDTLLHKCNQMKFPCLGLLLEEFRHYYLEDPNSLEDFLKRNQKRKKYDESPFVGCDSVTIFQLIDCNKKNQLIWEIKNNSILIKVSNDTIVFTPTFSPCDLNSFDKNILRFYDSDDNVIISSELDSVFKKGLFELRKEFPIVIQGRELDFILVSYTINNKILTLCADEKDFNKEWISAIEAYIRSFLIKHQIKSIIVGLLPCKNH